MYRKLKYLFNLAPQHGFESRHSAGLRLSPQPKWTRWLISRFSGTGLCQLSLQITTYSPFFDLSFENYCFTLT
jgi:hypothetical protein